ALDPDRARRIARAFRPERWFGDRTHYFYARAKLASDPLYPGIVEALRGSDAPLLDLGCGIGLLAHALRDAGLVLPYRGVDGVAFECVDLSQGLPAHRGNVAILDVLQFVSPSAQDAILSAAIGMLAPGAKLLIRTGLDDGSWRARTTRRIDAISRKLRWMNAGPQRYPEVVALRTRLEAAGLEAEFTPLYGRTPFNNWRIVATRPL